mmetsp:Transcript_12054/g.24035  ORF Transcript_12054/g.24035 Transcript_12054/m.24035 type:complete len:332 (+) Transcript_12054:142-1137(+)
MFLSSIKRAVLLASFARSVHSLYEEGCDDTLSIITNPSGDPIPESYKPELMTVDRYDPSTTMVLHQDCTYTFKLRFKHDPSLDSTDEQCVNNELAPDGVPFQSARPRWTFTRLPDDIKSATGLNHISIDFSDCNGHGGDLNPPLEAPPLPWTKPHYDIHMYYVSPEYRTCMSLDSPVNDEAAQTKPNGLAFFNPARMTGGSLSNMPADYKLARNLNSPYSGGHAWDPADELKVDAQGWDFPAILMSPYDGKIVTFEPMIPIENLTGNTDQKFTVPLTYVGQTMKELPNKFVLEYSAADGYSTITLTGDSKRCMKSGKGKKGKTGKKAAKLR